MAGLPYSEAIEKFKAMVTSVSALYPTNTHSDHYCVQIASEKHAKDHQYILKPVSGEGRV